MEALSNSQRKPSQQNSLIYRYNDEGSIAQAFGDKEKWVDAGEETFGNMGVGILDRVMKELQNGMFVNRQ